MTKLAKIKKGKIKWLHKTVDGDNMIVKFKKDYFPIILEKIRGNSKRPGIRLQITDADTSISSDSYTGRHFSQTTISKKKTILEWREIIFAELPDLGISLKYPVRVKPGDDIGKETSIIIENRGTSTAEHFHVDLYLSKDKEININGTNGEKDVPVENGRHTIAQLNPGENKTISLNISAKIPENLPPDTYYLAAFIDSENTVKELDENNNIYTGSMNVSVPAPKSICLNMKDAKLIYNPSTYDLKILCNGSVISDGKDWRKCRIKPYVHQLKHISWEDFHWEINTVEKGVFQIKGANFCKSGGKMEREIPITMTVKGGSKTVMPSEVVMNLPKTMVAFLPAENKLSILTHQVSIAHLPLWRTFRLKSHIYHIRNLNWKDSFWKINTFAKTAETITGGNFQGTETGDQQPLNAALKIE